MRADTALISTAFRYFVAAADAGSIRAAAREMNIASSAVNRQILRLEDILGMALFERTGRVLRLTDAGRVMLTQVRQAQQQYEDALSVIDAMRGLRTGTVRVATVESVSVNLLPGMLSSFASRFPEIGTKVTVSGSDEVTRMVQNREADLGFTFNPAALEGLETAYRKVMDVGAVISPDHPLTGKSQLTLNECLRFPVAYPARGLSLRKILDRVLKRLETGRPALIESNSLRVMSSLARDGRCVAFQTRIGIEHHLNQGALLFVPLEEEQLPADELMLVRQAARVPAPAAVAFFDHAIAVLNETFGD